MVAENWTFSYFKSRCHKNWSEVCGQKGGIGKMEWQSSHDTGFFHLDFEVSVRDFAAEHTERLYVKHWTITCTILMGEAII